MGWWEVEGAGDEELGGVCVCVCVCVNLHYILSVCMLVFDGKREFLKAGARQKNDRGDQLV